MSNHLARRRTAIGALAGLSLAATLGLAADQANADYWAKITAGTLQLTGDRAGDTLALQGSGLNGDSDNHVKTKIRVTLKGVKGPFKGFDVPAGRRLIGLELKFVNVGTLAYDNPLPHGELTVAGGENAKQTNLIAIGGKSPCENPSVKLRAGQSKSVCIAFDVPKADKPQSFQYVADSGFGDTGLWALR